MVPFVIRAAGAALALFFERSRRAPTNGARRRLPARAAKARTASQRAPADARRLAERAGARRLVDEKAPDEDSRGPSGLCFADRRASLRLCQCRLALAPFGARPPARCVSTVLANLCGNRRSNRHRGKKGPASSGRPFLERARVVPRRGVGPRLLGSA